VRLFFALWPEDDTVRQIESTASLLRLEAGARFVAAHNYHLTLAFIGEVAELNLAVLQQIGKTARGSGFTAVCDLLEHWPQPRAVVAAVRNAPAALLDLSARLHEAVELPQIPLRAHVTLARKVAQAPVLPAMSPILWRATEFSLVQSQTGSASSIYTVLDSWPLLYER
jgi:2'-5' RNA ligase